MRMPPNPDIQKAIDQFEAKQVLYGRWLQPDEELEDRDLSCACSRSAILRIVHAGTAADYCERCVIALSSLTTAMQKHMGPNLYGSLWHAAEYHDAETTEGAKKNDHKTSGASG